MPVVICPRCKHGNPDFAVYCYFDGVVLQAQQNIAAASRLPNVFVFPSGRRCQTYDELAQGCQEEWTSARDLLMRGMFAAFFRGCNRADLERAANDAKAQANPDIGLTTFLSSLPGTRTQTPKLDLQPRRILLGNLLVGESKPVSFTIVNQGQGMLQGTVTIAEGQDWVSLSDKGPLHEMAVNTVREQAVRLQINTRGIAAGQTYGAKLVVVTNGGVGEIPLRMDLIAQPYPKPPFQGVRTQRELAEKMRLQAKLAVPVLESGDIQRWFAVNGWTYPVTGPGIKGVGGVQQFFEGMGVSKPPTVQLSQTEFRFTCKYRDSIRGQVTLQTNIKKWVYAQLSSDSSWLKVLTPLISGPQHTVAQFEVDTNLWNQGPTGEGKITFTANGGQKIQLKVQVSVIGSPAIQPAKPVVPTMPMKPVVAPVPTGAITAAPPVIAPVPTPVPAPVITPAPAAAPRPMAMKFVPAFLTTLLLCLAMRVLMIPLADLAARQSSAAAAADRVGVTIAKNSPFDEIGGWLHLPWLPILGGSSGTFSAKVFAPDSTAEVKSSEFRHYFTTYFVRWFVLHLGWFGGVLGAFMVWRRGGNVLDLVWGLIAGIFAGFAGCATLAAFFLIGEMLPHMVWYVVFGTHGGIGYLLLWCLLSLFCWLLIGIALGIVIPLLTPLRHLLIDPFQSALASLFGIIGLKSLANSCAPA